ncbi:hypothetical protein IQ07DRAFT_602269 [Pyrenochaeta sp. DS3sAY3a]|nr:hypothetical protein IQ07DRAFT_602269 [Pyrenochaeta sp. DS3sAY3a]
MAPSEPASAVVMDGHRKGALRASTAASVSTLIPSLPPGPIVCASPESHRCSPRPGTAAAAMHALRAAWPTPQAARKGSAVCPTRAFLVLSHSRAPGGPQPTE